MPLRDLRRRVLRQAPQLKLGDPVTVVQWNGSIVQADIVGCSVDGAVYSARSKAAEHTLRADGEGTRWCRGHDGEDVDALRAAHAMMPTAEQRKGFTMPFTRQRLQDAMKAIEDMNQDPDYLETLRRKR